MLVALRKCQGRRQCCRWSGLDTIHETRHDRITTTRPTLERTLEPVGNRMARNTWPELNSRIFDATCMEKPLHQLWQYEYIQNYNQLFHLTRQGGEKESNSCRILPPHGSWKRTRAWSFTAGMSSIPQVHTLSPWQKKSQVMNAINPRYLHTTNFTSGLLRKINVDYRRSQRQYSTLPLGWEYSHAYLHLHWTQSMFICFTLPQYTNKGDKTRYFKQTVSSRLLMLSIWSD